MGGVADLGGPSQAGVLHARLLHGFTDLVRELGHVPDGLLDAVDIDDGPATYRQVILLMGRAATRLGVSDFGMRLARRQRGGGIFGPLGTAMSHSRLFGDAIDYVLAHNFAHSRSARIWSKRIEGEGAVFVGHEILDDAPGKGQVIEQILLVGNYGAMDLTGGYARARRVHFRHRPISPLAIYRRYFGCDVLFDQQADGVFYSDADLACPIVDSDAEAFRAATAYIDENFAPHRPPFQVEVRSLVMRLLGTEDCTNEGVAERLNLHSRTLHRRLRDENTSFRQIKEEVRREVMFYYLTNTDFDFTYISERLGFAEQSVMTRQSNIWFGAAPTQLRTKARA